MAQITAITRPEARATLSKALGRAGKELGLGQAEIARIIGRDRSALHRGIDPDSKAGELAVLLIRVYRSLYALVGGERDTMRHWMVTPNRHLGERPAVLIGTVIGLVQVVEYLDAMRGKG